MATSNCQLLVVLEEHFNEFLRGHCFELLREKGKILSSTNCFESWGKADVHEMACGSRIRKFPKGSSIVQQSRDVNYFCVLTKGVCSVLKFADGLADINRQIEDYESMLKKFSTQYSFHHSMRNRNVNDDVDVLESVTTPFKTSSEERIEELEMELGILRMKANKMEKLGDGDNRRLKLTTLIPGDIFGEACITTPYAPLSLGSIECETNCEVLMVHKSVLYQFSACSDDDFREAINRAAVIYPADPKLIDSISLAQEWKDYKGEVMKGIKKVRWPVNRERIRMVRGGSVVDRDLTLKFGPQE